MGAMGAAVPSPPCELRKAGTSHSSKPRETRLIPANPLDLRGRSLTFTPNGGGYDVEVGDSPPEAGLGRAVEIGDDASYFYDLDFTFPFFGEDHRRAFLNSDGNVTLQFSDSTSRTNVFGFLSGPPRIAALYADLNPELGGKVRVLDAPDRFVVTWEEISEYLELNRSTFQIVLEASGVIHLRYGDEIAARSGVSGITPGFDTSRFGAVDWSSGTADVFGPAFEHFTSHPELQLGPTASRFYSNFADQYDFLIVWTNFSTHMDGAFAFERNVQNDVRGIGLGSFDFTRFYGSAGRLQSVVMMGDVNRYPAAPRDSVYRIEDLSTLDLLGHEVGHRWLVFFRSDATWPLLGASNVHWSFFAETDASFMNGNHYTQESVNRFRTTEPRSQYSSLDLYLMGFLEASQVPPFFYIDNAAGRSGYGAPLTRGSRSERGIGVRGDKKLMTIDEVVGSEGIRAPGVVSSQKEFRLGWVVAYQPNRPPTDEQLAKIDLARRAFTGFFTEKTLGQGLVDSSLGQ